MSTPIRNCPQPESPIGTIVNPPLAHTPRNTQVHPTLAAIVDGICPASPVTRNLREGISDGVTAHQQRTEADLSWTAPEVVDALQWCLTELHESHCGCQEFHSALKVLRRCGGDL